MGEYQTSNYGSEGDLLRLILIIILILMLVGAASLDQPLLPWSDY